MAARLLLSVSGPDSVHSQIGQDADTPFLSREDGMPAPGWQKYRSVPDESTSIGDSPPAFPWSFPGGLCMPPHAWYTVLAPEGAGEERASLKGRRMRCGQCGHELDAGSTRCPTCGATMGRQCPNCMTVCPVGAVVCGVCNAGIPEDTPDLVLPDAAEDPLEAEAERRTNAVLARSPLTRMRAAAMPEIWPLLVFILLGIVGTLIALLLSNRTAPESDVPPRPRPASPESAEPPPDDAGSPEATAEPTVT